MKVCWMSKCVAMNHNNKLFIGIIHLCHLHWLQMLGRSELGRSKWDIADFPPSSNAA